jgi:hypothetical protein
LTDGVNLTRERIAIDIADRPSNMSIDLALTSAGKMFVVHAGSDDVSVKEVDVVRG